ncbi:hypothetical protein A2U01_0096686, partial [Trifolium medium]|nr:hypothetical protein [Trifolium medium]
MAGRMNGRGNQFAETLVTLANILARDHEPGREDEKRLERFMRHNPTLFTPEGAVKWVEE